MNDTDRMMRNVKEMIIREAHRLVDTYDVDARHHREMDPFEDYVRKFGTTPVNDGDFIFWDGKYSCQFWERGYCNFGFDAESEEAFVEQFLMHLFFEQCRRCYKGHYLRYDADVRALRKDSDRWACCTDILTGKSFWRKSYKDAEAAMMESIDRMPTEWTRVFEGAALCAVGVLCLLLPLFADWAQLPESLPERILLAVVEIGIAAIGVWVFRKGIKGKVQRKIKHVQSATLKEWPRPDSDRLPWEKEQPSEAREQTAPLKENREDQEKCMPEIKTAPERPSAREPLLIWPAPKEESGKMELLLPKKLFVIRRMQEIDQGDNVHSTTDTLMMRRDGKLEREIHMVTYSAHNIAHHTVPIKLPRDVSFSELDMLIKQSDDPEAKKYIGMKRTGGSI